MVGLGQVPLEQGCRPLEEEEKAVRTAKTRAGDTWLSHISPRFLLRGINIGPGVIALAQ